MNKLVITFLILLFFSSCSKKDENKGGVSTRIINYSKLNICNIDSFYCHKNVKYILLEKNDFFNLSIPEKIICKNKKIFILDFYKGFINCYNSNGRFLSSIQYEEDKIQKGKHHFCDFTISNSNMIYAVDGRKDVLFAYDDKFKLQYFTKLPFEIDIIESIDDSTFLYGLSSWNKGISKGYKISEGNSKANIVNNYFPYDNNYDSKIKISTYHFSRSKDYIAYHQAINDTIHLLNRLGKPIGNYLIDFGYDKIPDGFKKHIEKYYNSRFDKYIMLRKILYVDRNYIIGEILKYTKMIPFIINISNNKIYLGEDMCNSSAPTLVSVCGKSLCLFLDKEDSSLPDSVNKHVSCNGTALKLIDFQ